MYSMASALGSLGNEIVYFSCDHIDELQRASESPLRRQRIADLEAEGVVFQQVTIGKREVGLRHHPWRETDFYDLFDEKEFDVVQAAKAGHAEFPISNVTRTPVVEYRTLDARVDWTPAIRWSIHISEYQRRLWLKRGGKLKASSVIPIPVVLKNSPRNLRAELGISAEAVVVGMHQRVDDNIFSAIPLRAFAELDDENALFLMLGGSSLYGTLAAELGVRNFIQLPHSGDDNRVSVFLNTLDVFAHGRKDGETFGSVLAEAMSHGLPCISHKSLTGANGQPETMGPGGFFACNLVEYRTYLRELISNHSLRMDVGKSGKQYANAHYRVSSAAQQLSEVYSIVLSLDSRPIHLPILERTEGQAAAKKGGLQASHDATPQVFWSWNTGKDSKTCPESGWRLAESLPYRVIRGRLSLLYDLFDLWRDREVPFEKKVMFSKAALEYSVSDTGCRRGLGQASQQLESF